MTKEGIEMPVDVLNCLNLNLLLLEKIEEFSLLICNVNQATGFYTI